MNDQRVEARAFTVGGTRYACPHAIPQAKPLRGVPAGIAAAHRDTTADVS